MSIASRDNDTQTTKERQKRPKRVIIEEDSEENSSSSSSDEDDVPLFQRKAVRDLPKPTVKKVKLNVEDLEISKKKNNRVVPSQKNNNGFKAPLPSPKNNGFKTPLPSPKNNGFKAPVPTLDDIFKAPLSKNNNEFQAPVSYSSKGFKAPILPNGVFKAPAPPTKEFKAPAPPTAEFKAPLAVSSGEFKAPSTTGFAAPLSKDPLANVTENHQSDITSSRLAHYMTCICEDLDKYNTDKIKCVDSLLTFRENDDLPTLDITVMKKFTSLIATVNRQFKSLDSVDMIKFGKIIKLMENTIIVSTDIDMIDYYGKHIEEKASVLEMMTQVNDALDTCLMIFEILTTCKLDKKFLSRNLITHCLHFIKNQLDYTIYPLIDLNGFGDDTVSYAKSFLSLITSSPKEKQLLSTLIPQMIRFFKKAFTLILSEDLDDDVLVIVAYISMAPFFHEYTESILLKQDNEATFNPYEHLKFCALDILKHIFSRYPKHRRWIFEEILTSLGTLTTMDGKRSYRLRNNNQSIHVISALFMQLVQCSSSLSVTTHQHWFRKWNIKYQKAFKNKAKDQMKLLDDKLIQRATDAWRSGAEAAANAASFFLEFLMSKCKSKKIDAYSLAEYRQILFQTLQDIMVVFNDPDWPVAELIMRVFSRILISLLEENHSDQFLKSLAIEWLGIIACKIKTGYNTLAGGYKTYTPEWVCDLNETLPIKFGMETPLRSFALLDQCRKKILDQAMEDKVSSSITNFYLCNWGFIESVLWTKANKGWEVKEKKSRVKPSSAEDKPKENEKEETVAEEDDLDGDITMVEPKEVTLEVKWPEETALLLEETCKYYWLTCIGVEHPFPKFDTHFVFPAEMSRNDDTYLTELLASRQTLYTSFNFILSEILTCLEKDAVIYRTKALRAIGKIAIEVPEILEDKRIHQSVVQKVHDGSPSVRDAAVEVVAKYLGRLDTIPIKLYQVVSGRILDTAVNVRKRLVKLLRELYFKFYDPEIKIDIASKLILRIGDNEITISQLSLKVTQEILFQPFKEIEKEGNDYFGYSYANSPKERKRKITELTKVITGAVSKLDSSLSAQHAALSQIIQKTVDGADEKSLLWYDKVFQWIVDSLFDRMIILDGEGNSKEFIHCLATVLAFTKSCPHLLRETHITMLQPYLCISSEEDWTKARYVLIIYRDILPRMKYHDPEFIQSVERILLQLSSKCPKDIVSFGVSCLCVIVDRISYRYNILIKMLGSCINKLRQVRELIEHGGDLPTGSFAGVLKMLMICGLLCQHFEYDKKRQQEPEAMEALNLVYRGEINTLVFDLLQFFTSDMMDELDKEGISLRATALQGLGYFFSSYPIFMISKTSTTLMDKIFEQGTFELKTQLMHVFQEFLAAEEKRIDKKQEQQGDVHTQDISIDTLLGNTEEYAELGVNGSLMQRYLKKILKCALSHSDTLRYAAFEVVSSIIHQGLAHPVLCMSAIMAAETSPDIILRTKAYYLHKYAHDKYGSILYSQLSDYLSTSYEYQKLLFDEGHVLGYGQRGGDLKVDPVLGLSYSVLKEKKKSRFDFLSALVNPFRFDLKSTDAEEIDIYYLKYLAENTMTLDFCTTEEVLHVVYIMDRILTSLGADLLSYVHFLKKQGIITIEEEEDDEKELDQDLVVASKLAIVMCMLLYLKNLLVELYDIPDDEIREFNPNIKKKGRDVSKDIEVNGFIDWHQLLYFKKAGTLNRRTASDACYKFEHLIMSDTTAQVHVAE